MAEQKRYWNWEDDDLTFELARALIGFIDAGLYRGFDAVLNNDMTLVLNHATTGAARTKKDKTFGLPFGLVSTRQGIFIQEERDIELDITATGVTGRKDLIVIDHEYVDVAGGRTALYAVIEGTEDDFPTIGSTTQVILGYLTLPANTTSLEDAGVIYERAPQPKFANHIDYVTQENGFLLSDLDAGGFKIINLLDPVTSQDAATKFYVDEQFNIKVKDASETIKGILEIATLSEASTGADDERAITPAKLKYVLDLLRATQAEVITGNESTKFVTSKTLHNKNASTAEKGLALITTLNNLFLGTQNNTIVSPYALQQYAPARPIIVPMPVWDMTADNNIAVAHDLASQLTADLHEKVVSITAIIIGNDEKRYSIQEGDLKLTVDDTNVAVEDRTGSDFFDVANFNGTAASRGYFVIWVSDNLVPVTIPNILTVNAGADKSGGAYVNESGSALGSLAITAAFINTIGSALDSFTWTVQSFTLQGGGSGTAADYTITAPGPDPEDLNVSFKKYGTMVLRLTATNADMETAYDDVTLVFNKIAVPTFTLVDISSPTSVTPSSTSTQVAVNLTAEVTGGLAPYTYSAILVNSSNVPITSGADYNAVNFILIGSNTIRATGLGNSTSSNITRYFRVTVTDSLGNTVSGFKSVIYNKVASSGGGSSSFALSGSATATGSYIGNIIVTGLSSAIVNLEFTVTAAGGTAGSLQVFARSTSKTYAIGTHLSRTELNTITGSSGDFPISFVKVESTISFAILTIRGVLADGTKTGSVRITLS